MARSVISSSLLYMATATIAQHHHTAHAASRSDFNPMAQPPPQRRNLMGSSNNNNMPFINSNNIESLIPEGQLAITDKEKRALLNNWMSMNEDVEFLPLMRQNQNKNSNDDNANDANSSNNAAAANSNNKSNAQGGRGRTASTTTRRELADQSSTTGAHDASNPYSVQPFVSGMGDYDEGQQAWRLLGFMIDCNEVETDDDYQDSGGSNDGGTEEGSARYLLWAAYVDLEYEGCGIGEYQYWDKENNVWDTTSCEYAQGGSGDNGGDACGRCAKMDCHLEDTHFSVLGFFKHRNYDDWMEQLFKHEGICVWSNEEYAFMKNAYQAWPGGCVDTGHTNDAGGELYYNIKPMQNGRIGVGLYTDVYCLEEHPADTDTIESIVGNIFQGGSGGSGDNYNYDFSQESFAESLDRWNSAFDTWHTCHPCIAYDIENLDGTKYAASCYDDDNYQYNYDDQYNYNQRNRKDIRDRRELGGEYCAEGDIFECYDDAGYTGVNQVCRLIVC